MDGIRKPGSTGQKLQNVLVSDIGSGGFRLGPGGAQAPPNLAQAPQIFDWFSSALFL